jgi:hypothetical protein
MRGSYRNRYFGLQGEEWYFLDSDNSICKQDYRVSRACILSFAFIESARLGGCWYPILSADNSALDT